MLEREIRYEIHSVEEHQLPECLDAIHAAFDESAKIYGYTKETYPTSAAYLTLEELKEARESGVHIYAAYVDGKVAGCVQLEKQGEGVYMFRRFAVLPEYQKLGIGRALVSHCRERGVLYGGKILRLVMNAQNGRLRSFYQGNGFSVVSTHKDGKYPFEYCIMELDLTRDSL